MYRKLLGISRKIIPSLSKTELIALKSGTTCIDRDIFNGYLPIHSAVNSDDKNVEKFQNKLNHIFNKYGRDKVFTKEQYNSNIVDDLYLESIPMIRLKNKSINIIQVGEYTN